MSARVPLTKASQMAKSNSSGAGKYTPEDHTAEGRHEEVRTIIQSTGNLTLASFELKSMLGQVFPLETQEIYLLSSM